MSKILLSQILPSQDAAAYVGSETRAAEKQDTGKQGIGKENEIYTSRFSEKQDKARAHTWQVLCRDFFQRYILTSDIVVDVGAGDGLFITNIQAQRRIAVDLSAHVQSLKSKNVEVLQLPATNFARALGEQADVIFMSNFLEHLPTKQLVLQVFEECQRALKTGGKLLILQPNIRYAGAAYWDYIDHHIALTEHSLVEGLQVSGFKIVQLIPRFLPYTAKSRLGRFSGLVNLYLKIPLVWRLFGQQTFAVAVKD